MQDSQFACNGSITSNWRPDNGLNQHLASHHTDRPRARAGRWLLRAGRWLLRAAPRHGSGTLRDCANFRQLCLELGLAISIGRSSQVEHCPAGPLRSSHSASAAGAARLNSKTCGDRGADS
jgi:hypothetical protein